MPKREDFPVWTRNRAQRHLARGCSRRFVGLILRLTNRRASLPIADARPSGGLPSNVLPSNVLPFRIPEAAQHLRPAPAIGADLRHG